jgi:hypothetical protein
MGSVDLVRAILARTAIAGGLVLQFHRIETSPPAEMGTMPVNAELETASHQWLATLNVVYGRNLKRTHRPLEG